MTGPSEQVDQLEGAAHSARPAASGDEADVSDSRRWAPETERRARTVFALAIATAGLLIVATNQHVWFNSPDEWRFLTGRDAGSIDDLLRAHSLVHWSTIPILYFRFAYTLVGLHSYWPYVLPVIALHLTAAVLLRMVMARSGVHPWIATTAAALFAFFGAGHQNIIWAFQIGFNAALVLGLIHLLLADHDGPMDRRDALGLAAGMVALMCSGVAVTMTIVVGLAALARRGWKPALVHTVPLGLVYMVWWLAYADPSSAERDRGSPSQWLDFVWTGMSGTFEALGRSPVVGVGLAVLLAAGLMLAWSPLRGRELRRAVALPGALLVGSLVFLWITALGRVAAELGPIGTVLGPEVAQSSRYLHIVAALCLPALAVAADALARRWRPALIVAVAIFLLGLPGNTAELMDPETQQFSEPNVRFNQQLFLNLAQAPLLESVPGTVTPHPRFSEVTVDWLLEAEAAGRVPDPEDSSARDANTAAFHLTVAQQATAGDDCEPIDFTADIRLGSGEAIRIAAAPRSVVTMFYVADDASLSGPRQFALVWTPIIAAAAPVTLRLEPNIEVTAVERCA